MMRGALVLPGMSKATLGSGTAEARLVRDAVVECAPSTLGKTLAPVRRQERMREGVSDG